MSKRLVTIVLTTYNRAHLISQMLDSILRQTYVNWECIIIDDNSKDDTDKVIYNYIDNNNRFQLIKKPLQIKQGLPASRNIGIKKAKGDFLVFFDDDDIVHPELLETCMKEFSENKNIDFVHYKKQSFKKEFCYSSVESVNKYSIIKYNENIYEEVITGKIPMASCTVVWKSKLFKYNLFNEDLMYAEEWECYSRMLINNKIKGVKINVPLYYNRKHVNSNTGEFWSKNSNRLNSYVLAHQLICELLLVNNKMNTILSKYFIQKSYHLKSKEITKMLLSQSFKYKIRSVFFPIKYKLYKILK